MNTCLVKGNVFDIHRLSTHDGPGLRTTVFLKGCSLKCTWCHNPESIHSYSELQWLHNKCIACGLCVKACTRDALTQSSEGITIDRQACNRCMDCVKACPSGAMNQLGEERDIESVMEEVLQDKLFYKNSDGGLTISGGEPLLQVTYVVELLKRAKVEGIHTAIDTSLQVAQEAIELVLPYVDLWLVDMKESDLHKRQKFIAADGRLIEHNMLYLLEHVKDYGKLWVRTPLIPGATAREDNILGIGHWLKEHHNSAVDVWELCTFNNLCGDKYHKLDLKWEFDGTELMLTKDKETYKTMAMNLIDGEFEVRVSGLTR